MVGGIELEYGQISPDIVFVFFFLVIFFIIIIIIIIKKLIFILATSKYFLPQPAEVLVSCHSHFCHSKCSRENFIKFVWFLN